MVTRVEKWLVEVSLLEEGDLEYTFATRVAREVARGSFN